MSWVVLVACPITIIHLIFNVFLEKNIKEKEQRKRRKFNKKEIDG